jgi:phosphatidylserine decarboxylase
MRLDRAGAPFIAGALAPAAVFAALRRPAWALSFGALGAFFCFFFRDPDRQVPSEPDVVVSPADGRVLVAGVPEPHAAPQGEWRQVSIFLSPLDVHINRVPVAGTIVRVDYRPGRFLPAYQPGAGVSNERNEIWIDRGGETIVCRQIAGVLARRVVCRVQPGARVSAGERFGLMKFGSRIDLFLPPRAVLLVGRGDRVRAGESILARL